MGPFLELLYDVIFSPAAAMRQIAARRPVGQAFVAFLLSIVIPAGAIYFVLQATATGKFAGAFFAAAVCVRLLMWFVGSAVLQLIAELFGGQGTAVGLFAAIGFAHLPFIFAVPLAVADLTLTPTASIGIAVHPDDGMDFDTLLRQADAAMYRAKQAGRNRVERAAG